MQSEPIVATAAGVLVAGALFTTLGGRYPVIGTYGSCIHALAMIAVWWAPRTDTLSLDD
jgi:hypothetical protein